MFVSICTGRMYSGTRHIALELELDGPVGCLDGSHVVDVRTDQDVSRHALDELAAGLLLPTLDACGAPAFVFAGDSILHDEQGEEFLDYVRAWSNRAERLDSLHDPSLWQTASGVAAVVSLGEQSMIVRALALLEEHAEAHVQAVAFPVRHPSFIGKWGLLARKAGVDKASALRVIADHYGVSLDETVTVGDWVNDISMLRAAGRSFAMAQSPQSVKDAATDVLDADLSSGGGIEEAARRAGLL